MKAGGACAGVGGGGLLWCQCGQQSDPPGQLVTVSDYQCKLLGQVRK